MSTKTTETETCSRREAGIVTAILAQGGAMALEAAAYAERDDWTMARQTCDQVRDFYARDCAQAREWTNELIIAAGRKRFAPRCLHSGYFESTLGYPSWMMRNVDDEAGGAGRG